METYGLIYNKDILNKYFGLSGAKAKSIDDIDSFKTLKAVADDMQARKDELGIKGARTRPPASIPAPTGDSRPTWPTCRSTTSSRKTTSRAAGHHQGHLPGELQEHLRPVHHGLHHRAVSAEPKTGDDANSEFALGEAAFYQNGTWAWTNLQNAGMTAEQVGMMPIYIGDPDEQDEGLATGSENYWCINSKASEADQKATAEFLKWVITSDTGKEALSTEMGFTTPFKTFDDIKTDNPLVAAAVADQKSGKTQVSWNFTMMPSEQWKNDLGNALLEYAQGTQSWDAVKTAFVDGWAKSTRPRTRPESDSGVKALPQSAVSP